MHKVVTESREGIPKAQTPPFTILVVEDDPLVRLFTADILRGAGYHVVEAGTASEALMALASDQDIHLLFSDVLLPGSMGGLTLAEWANVNRSNMPVILSSGAGAVGRYLEGRESVAFMAKPYNARELLSVVSDLLPTRG